MKMEFFNKQLNKILGIKSEINLDLNRVLPSELVINPCGTHLYSYGISLFGFYTKKRKRLYNPILIFIINSILIIRMVIALLSSEDNSYLLIIVGDFSHYYNMRIHLNICLSQLISISLISQLINIWYYYKDIKPSFLKPFEMMSGLVSPKSIGLKNKPEIYRLLKRSKILFIVCLITSYISLLMTFFVSISTLALNYEHIYQFIFYGIPWSFIVALSVYYSSCHILWQISYFYITCFYLKIKFKTLSNEITVKVERNSRITNNFVKYLINSYGRIFREVHDYNENYWSLYLFSVLATFLTFINTCLFVGIFSEANFFVRFVMIHGSVTSYIIFAFIINTASSIAFEALKAYKLLNSHLLKNFGENITPSRRVKV
jgi:hypothetical protein